MKTLRPAMLAMLLVITLFLTARAEPPAQGPLPGPPYPTDQALIDQLQQETESKVRISYHAKTGKVRFIGTDLAHAIPPPIKLAAQATPEEAARQFLDVYGQLFGLTNQAQELTVLRIKTVDRGRSFVRFQQVYKGIPVLGGELIVQMDASKNIVSAHGEVLPDLELDTVARINAETARLRALTRVAKDYSLSVNDLMATEPELWIYNPNLLGGPGPSLTTLVWRIEVQPKELLPIRELVLVNAHLGFVALHFNQIDAAKNRCIYDNQNNPAYGLPGNGPVRCEGQGPTGITDVDNAYDYGGDTYDFYWNTHGRDSLDNAGMDLISTVRYCPNSTYCPYENAFWSGQQMVYGDGYASADDVVAHEMTHGVTQYESNLFYYMQSGAINEAFSDIWGEFVDLTNGAGNDTTGVRWLIGEDLPLGAFRSMSNPPAYDSGLGPMPDRMTSTNYYCGRRENGGVDNGGVHHNMGVGSKAAYLMVDGDTFNGYTVTGIGIDKTAKIFYEIQTNLFTSAADYQDLYDGLYQACTNLIGTSGITAADCQEVRDATDATEMNQQPTSCPATHAPICDSGAATTLFFDDMENTSSGNWASAAIVGSNEWYYPQNSHPYTGFNRTYATSGIYNIWGYNQELTADYYMAMTSDVTLPSGSWPYLHFNHAYAFVKDGTIMYDGGVVEYSTNSGSSWNDAGPLFTHNGYDGTIDNSNGNPLGGRSAFGGESGGYFSSRLDLSSLAGQSVRFRFRIGTDGIWGAYGWFIDDFRIYTCATTDTSFPIDTTTSDQWWPTGAYNEARKEYLVTWFEGPSYRRDVYARRVSAAGAPVGPRIAVTTAHGEQKYPAIAYNSQDNEYLIVWIDELASGVKGQRLLGDGTLIGADFSITTASARGGLAVTYNSMRNIYLVVWQDYRSSSYDSDIYGQIVYRGDLIGGNFPISTASGSQSSPSVAYNSADDEYMIVWSDERNYSSSSYDVYGQRVSYKGTLLGGNVGIATLSISESQPDVAFNGLDTEYLVVWGQGSDSAGDIYGQRISRSGGLEGTAFPLTTAANQQGEAAVVFNGVAGGYMAVWADSRNGSSNSDIYGQQVSRAGILEEGNFVVRLMVNNQNVADIVANTGSGEYLALWQDMRSGIDYDIYGRVLMPQCYILTTSVSPSGSGKVSVSPSPTCQWGKHTSGTQVQLTANPAQGYNFSHWSGDASGSANPTTVTMDGDKSVTANFAQQCYTLTTSVSPSGGGTVSVSPSPNCEGGKYTSGTVVQLTANPAQGYNFSHWSGDASGSANPTTITMNSDKSVFVCFLLGDLDGDGDVDVDDIMRVASRWRAKCGDPDSRWPSYDPLYDLDDDCDIDIVDIMLVVKHWGETCESALLYVLTEDGIVEVSLTGSKQTIIGAHGGTCSIEIFEDKLYASEGIYGGNILVYDLQGNPLKTIPIPPQASEYLCFVTLPDERIALMDNLNDKVYFIDSSGNLLAKTNI